MAAEVLNKNDTSVLLRKHPRTSRHPARLADQARSQGDQRDGMNRPVDSD